MKAYSFLEAPIKIYGVKFGKNNRLVRLSEDVAETVNETTKLRNYNSMGGRVRFKTDSSFIIVKTKLETNRVDWAVPLSGSAGADAFVGVGESSRWIGIAAPRDYDSLETEGWLHKEKVMETVTINLPRNEPILDLTVLIEDDATICEAEEYTYSKPIVFYGSSITEGGCATSPGNSYTSLVSRWLDADHINLGFSNASRGEEQMANYIKQLDMSVFVMDYDHNANDKEQLEQTHEKFYKIIRKAQLELPIVIITKPDFDSDKQVNADRRAVIKATYDNAVASGDKRVWFIDGETLFGDNNRSVCTVEGCHPNDLGFMRMAQTIYPVLKEALKYSK